MKRTQMMGLVVGLSALVGAGCGSGETIPQSSARSSDATPVQEVDVPAAILGQAVPPRGEAVNYVPGDPTTTGYLSIPDGDGPFPSVILIHEWNGLVDRIRQVADAFADEGYVALAADLYRGQVGTSRDENMALMNAAREDPGAIIANLDAAAAFLRARTDVTGKIAAMGWCFGGGVALSFALGGVNHEGTAIFYGRLVDDPERLQAITHEVYGTFAEQDGGIPPADVERFADALRTAGVENDIHIYDDVGHGFWLYVDRDPDNALAPAADAWGRLTDYLDRTIRE